MECTATWPIRLYSHLRYSLRTERGFTENGANEFIRQFRKTIEYADLGKADRMETEDQDDADEELQMDESTAVLDRKQPPPGGKVRSINLPLSPTEWATLQAPFPMTERQWVQMKAVLDAMKPALVEDDEAPE